MKKYNVLDTLSDDLNHCVKIACIDKPKGPVRGAVRSSSNHKELINSLLDEEKKLPAGNSSSKCYKINFY